jgi:hypothetical protein
MKVPLEDQYQHQIQQQHLHRKIAICEATQPGLMRWQYRRRLDVVHVCLDLPTPSQESA